MGAIRNVPDDVVLVVPVELLVVLDDDVVLDVGVVVLVELVVLVEPVVVVLVDPEVVVVLADPEVVVEFVIVVVVLVVAGVVVVVVVVPADVEVVLVVDVVELVVVPDVGGDVVLVVLVVLDGGGLVLDVVDESGGDVVLVVLVVLEDGGGVELVVEDDAVVPFAVSFDFVVVCDFVDVVLCVVPATVVPGAVVCVPFTDDPCVGSLIPPKPGSRNAYPIPETNNRTPATIISFCIESVDIVFSLTFVCSVSAREPSGSGNDETVSRTSETPNAPVAKQKNAKTASPSGGTVTSDSGT